MNSDMFKLGSNDFVKGLATALIAAVVVALAGIVQQPGFDIFAANWGGIGGQMLNIAIVTFIAYMSKNFISDSQGKVLGRIG